MATKTKKPRKLSRLRVGSLYQAIGLLKAADTTLATAWGQLVAEMPNKTMSRVVRAQQKISEALVDVRERLREAEDAELTPEERERREYVP